jgi:hypothetical protein
VLVLGSKDFDPSQIVTSSLKFGPAEVAPLSAKLVPGEGRDEMESDEDETWERVSSSFGRDRHNPAKHRNLLLVFDEASLDVQCGLDQALFLTGQTQVGMKIVGGAATKLAGCDVKHPGRRHGKKPNSKTKNPVR